MNLISYQALLTRKGFVFGILYSLFILSFFVVGSAVGNAPMDADEIASNAPAGADHDTLLDIAERSGSFKTLVAAIEAAGLEEILSGDGPFTIFAPTDEAFARLPEESVNRLLAPENRSQLASLLTFHVLPGEIRSADLLSAYGVETVNGARLPLGLRIGAASVVNPDIEASNGVIHVIDRVLRVPVDVPGVGGAMLIRAAIERGAPLFNHGQAAACAAIYEITTVALLKLDRDLPEGARASLTSALRDYRALHNDRDRAWALRKGLDRAYNQLASTNSMMTTESL